MCTVYLPYLFLRGGGYFLWPLQDIAAGSFCSEPFMPLVGPQALLTFCLLLFFVTFIMIHRLCCLKLLCHYVHFFFYHYLYTDIAFKGLKLHKMCSSLRSRHVRRSSAVLFLD